MATHSDPDPDGAILITVMTDETRPLSIVGEFNDWDPTRHPFVQEADGASYITLAVPPNSPLEFTVVATPDGASTTRHRIPAAAR